MICEVRNNNSEVILKNPTISDIFAFIYLLFHKDKEVCFTNPQEGSEIDGRNP